MNCFAERCGLQQPARALALARSAQLIDGAGVEQVRFAWCDLHGSLRCKTLMAGAAQAALRDGVGMVSTLLLKDTSDRSTYQVFEPGAVQQPFAGAGNLLLLADPASYQQLPWLPHTGWMQGQLWFPDGTPVSLDTRQVLREALAALHQAGFGLQCGLEVELHIYRVATDGWREALDPGLAAWPGLPPTVELIHPGYNLLSEGHFDQAHQPLAIVQHTARALGLPLRSLEIELGPSQVEAVFEVSDALTAADNMVLFRSAVRQALRRAGYHASFMCRPPFPNVMSSGWHLHQSLVDRHSSANLFMRDSPEPGAGPHDAGSRLSALGEHYLAGLLTHAGAISALAVPTINGFERFRPNALAPRSIVWGADNRGAMLRVLGRPGDGATRIENRIGEPSANPYLYVASQIHAGLDGIRRTLRAAPASVAPYADDQPRLPANLSEALGALSADQALVQGFGRAFVDYYCHIKRAEIARHAAAEDPQDWQRREYFSRY